MAKSKSLVKDYMTKNVVTVSPQTTTSEVIKLMKESDHNSYPVVENNKLVGMVTSFDIVVKDYSLAILIWVQVIAFQHSSGVSLYWAAVDYNSV